MSRWLQQYIIDDGIIHIAVMRRIILFSDVDIVVDRVNSNRLQRLDDRLSKGSSR